MKTIRYIVFIFLLSCTLTGAYAQNDNELLLSTSSTLGFQAPGSGSTVGQVFLKAYPGNRTLQILPARTGDGEVLNGFIFDVGYTNTGGGNNGFLFRTGSSNRFIINENGNIGIGTTSPTEIFHVSGSGYIRSLVESTDNHAYYEVQGAAGKGSFVDYYRNGDGRLWHTGLRPDTDNLEFRLDNQSSVLTLTQTENVGIGTTTPTEKLSVNGKIRSKEVIVEATGWPDYVFADDYELLSLAEVEGFIHKHGHLPGVSPAEEVEEKGQFLGDTQQQLLKKIEEMTLYMIELKKENDALTKRIEQLEISKKN